MKQKALIIFKTELYWNKFIIKKFQNFMMFKCIYLINLKKLFEYHMMKLMILLKKNKIEIVYFLMLIIKNL